MSAKSEKLAYCIIVREMDNPSLSLLHQEDFSELLASYGGGAGTGDRLPLLVYKVYPEDGREEVIRGARIVGVNTRSLRNLAGIGNDNFVYNYMQSQIAGFSGTALGAFGAANGGLPASIVAPSLLFEELEVRGARGEPKRLAAASGSATERGEVIRRVLSTVSVCDGEDLELESKSRPSAI